MLKGDSALLSHIISCIYSPNIRILQDFTVSYAWELQCSYVMYAVLCCATSDCSFRELSSVRDEE